MRGFMRQRGGSWELRAYVGRDGATGKKRWVTRTVRGGKREAERALAALVAEADRGNLKNTTATVEDLLERWFEHARGDFSPSTERETRSIIDRTLVPGIGSIPLARLEVGDIDRFYRRLRRNGGKDRRPLAASTVRRAHVVLRRALNQGVKWGWLARNPAADASPPKVAVSEIRPPTPSDVAKLFRLARENDPQLATFVLLAAAIGARRSELIALRWSDIDLERGTITVSRGVVLGAAGLVEKDTKTHSARRVALSPGTVEELHGHRQRNFLAETDREAANVLGRLFEEANGENEE